MRDGILDHVNTDQYISQLINASGVAQGFIGPVAAGYLWYVERMSAYSNTAKTSGITLEVAVQNTNQIPASATTGVAVWDRESREDYTGSPQNDIADENSPIYVPEGYYLVAYWAGFNQGDLVTLGTQIAVHLRSLAITPRQLFRQEHESSVGVLEPKHHETHHFVPEHAHAGPTADSERGGVEVPEPTHDEKIMAVHLDLLRDQ